MSINPLIPIAGVYAIEAARHIVQPLSAGASFAQTLLAGPDKSEEAHPTEALDTASTYRFERLGPIDRQPTGDSRRQSRVSHTSPDMQRQVDDFQSLLSQRMLAAGLDPFTSMRLQSDAWGRLEMVADHPKAEEIETLVTRDPALSRAFQGLVELFQRLNATADATAASGVEHSDSRLSLGSWRPKAESGRPATIEITISRESINISVSG